MATVELGDISGDGKQGVAAVVRLDDYGAGNEEYITVSADQQYAIANDDAAIVVAASCREKGTTTIDGTELTTIPVAPVASGTSALVEHVANLPVNRSIVVGPGYDRIYLRAASGNPTVTISASTRFFGYR